MQARDFGNSFPSKSHIYITGYGIGRGRLEVDVIGERPHLFLGSRLKRLAEQMQADVIQVAEAAGLGVQAGQYPILATLDAVGASTIGELARMLKISQPAMTKAVSRLVKAELVRVQHVSADGRQRAISLTEAGRKALDVSKRSIWPKVEFAVKELMDGLGVSFLDQLTTIENRLSERSLTSRIATDLPRLIPASEADLPTIVSLINRAYRGVGNDAGWNSEAGYIEGDRTSEPLLREEMAQKADGSLLLWRTAGALIGCVWLEPISEGLWYLGSLAIDPKAQASGAGRRLLAAAETWVLDHGGTTIRMTVVNVRESLIAWYIRRGYALTGVREPFPYEDARFGMPRRDDLSFVELRKALC